MKTGDKVIFNNFTTGDSQYSPSYRNGGTGVVLYTHGEYLIEDKFRMFVTIKWDHDQKISSVLYECLSVIPDKPDLKIGDRVKVIKMPDGWISYGMPDLIWKMGSIKSLIKSFRVGDDRIYQISNKKF